MIVYAVLIFSKHLFRHFVEKLLLICLQWGIIYPCILKVLSCHHAQLEINYERKNSSFIYSYMYILVRFKVL